MCPSKRQGDGCTALADTPSKIAAHPPCGTDALTSRREKRGPGDETCAGDPWTAKGSSHCVCDHARGPPRVRPSSGREGSPNQSFALQHRIEQLLRTTTCRKTCTLKGTMSIALPPAICREAGRKVPQHIHCRIERKAVRHIAEPVHCTSAPNGSRTLTSGGAAASRGHVYVRRERSRCREAASGEAARRSARHADVALRDWRIGKRDRELAT
jgi:hypothetical protein